MKEQDYIRIMDRIRNDHIENAMLWDVSAQQQSRRSIRRLSLGVGAIAACIAVVIGCIGYSVHREHLANPSGETSGAENGDQHMGHLLQFWLGCAERARGMHEN